MMTALSGVSKDAPLLLCGAAVVEALRRLIGKR